MPVSQACCRCAAVVCSCSLPGNRVVPVHFGAVCVGMGDKMQGPWSIVLVEGSSADGPYLVHNKRAAVTVHESASDGDEDIVQLNLYCKQPVFNDEKADEKSTLFAYQTPALYVFGEDEPTMDFCVDFLKNHGVASAYVCKVYAATACLLYADKIEWEAPQAERKEKKRKSYAVRRDNGNAHTA